MEGWEDLAEREEAVSVQAGDPIVLSPDRRVDPQLALYGQSRKFRRYTAETKRNYTTDIALLLTALWRRGRSWTEATSKDLNDFEDWRRYAVANPTLIGGSKWNRELAAFESLYSWAKRKGYLRQNPILMKEMTGRNGEVLRVPEQRANDSRPSNVHWLTPRTWRRWIDIGLRGHTREGVPEPGWVGRLEDRNVAFVRTLNSSGLRLSEGGSLLTFEVPKRRLGGGRYYRGKVAAEVTRSKKQRTFYVASDAVGDIETYAASSRAWVVR
ncbi:site-specific integrase [Streptomyces sp. NPDC058001]|uniref:site-specific integrase n=1 Tax=Streptomyces sp. NPDC058001 TaxID=3346300 RepID=UPI0036E1D61C